jgi:hypothetical protein
MDNDDDSGGGRWLTYGEIAAARGTTRIAAVRLTQRHKWRRQRGNDGHARVLVPPDMLQPERPPPSGVDSNIARDVTADVPALLAAIETAHLGEVTALRGEIEALKKLADNATARVVDAEAIQAGLRSRLTEAEGRAIAATSRAEQAEARANQARAEAEEAIQGAERLRQAGAARAEQAEARADQERLAADRFRAEVEAARAEAAVAQEAAEARLSKAVEAHGSEVSGLRVRADDAVTRAERAEDERDAAREAHAKAMAANRKWEAADAARKAGGRLRRAWDGWRGC